mmetsp:Transcript_6124/g.13196  ORF Transcript_6124/g.13196 Transcript_6124/m.13196 type:complete len:271 (-) Transcript_6124:1419-2231(-)
MNNSKFSSNLKCNYLLNKVRGVRIQEQKLLVRGQGPNVGRNHLLRRIASLADINHGLQSEYSCQLGLLIRVLRGVDGRHCILETANRGLQVGQGSNTSFFDRGDDMLIDHVDQGKGLHLHSAGVVIMEDDLASIAFGASHDIHGLEELFVLRSTESVDGFYTTINSPYTTLGQHILVFLTVIVTVEDDLPVLFKRLSSNVIRTGSSLNLIRKFLELGRSDSVKHGVHHGDILCRSHRTEFKPGTSVREGTGTVTVLCRYLEGHDGGSAQV